MSDQPTPRMIITERSIALAGEIKARLPHMTVTRDHDVVTAARGDGGSAYTQFKFLPGVSIAVTLFYVGAPERGVTWPEELSATAIVQRAQEAGLL